MAFTIMTIIFVSRYRSVTSHWHAVLLRFTPDSPRILHILLRHEQRRYGDRLDDARTAVSVHV